MYTCEHEHLYICILRIYIYVYIYRERATHIYIYIYIFWYIVGTFLFATFFEGSVRPRAVSQGFATRGQHGGAHQLLRGLSSFRGPTNTKK